MDANSAAPTIATKVRNQLRHMLLAAKLGTYPLAGGPESWTTYHWMMETVWLEMSSRTSSLAGCHRPIPAMTTCWPRRWRRRSRKPRRLEYLEVGVRRIPSLSRIRYWDEFPLCAGGPVRRTTAIWQRIHRQSRRPGLRSLGAIYRRSSNLDSSTLNIVTGQSGNLLSPLLHGSVAGVVHRQTFTLPFRNQPWRLQRRIG